MPGAQGARALLRSVKDDATARRQTQLPFVARRTKGRR